jgi:hypothetical protein
MKRDRTAFVVTPVFLVALKTLLTINIWEAESGCRIVDIAEHSIIVSHRCWILLMLHMGVF